MYVSEIVITVLGYTHLNIKTKERKEFLQPSESSMITLMIDGNVRKVRCKQLVINSLMKNDGEHASIPIQTFLPFVQEAN